MTVWQSMGLWGRIGLCAGGVLLAVTGFVLCLTTLSIFRDPFVPSYFAVPGVLGLIAIAVLSLIRRRLVVEGHLIWLLICATAGPTAAFFLFLNASFA